MKRILAVCFILALLVSAGCQASTSPTAGLITASPTAMPTPTEKSLSVKIMNLYEASMAMYNQMDYYNYHSSIQMDFTADGKTDRIYKDDIIAQARDLNYSGRFYYNETIEALRAISDERTDVLRVNRCLYNDDTYVYVKRDGNWEVNIKKNYSINEKCLSEDGQGILTMLTNKNITTIMTKGDATSITKKVSGDNTIYTFGIEQYKMHSLIEDKLGLEYDFTINSCFVTITVNAESLVIRDEYTANISIKMFGKEGELDIKRYCQYLEVPTIAKPTWTEYSVLMDSISEGR